MGNRFNSNMRTTVWILTLGVLYCVIGSTFAIPKPQESEALTEKEEAPAEDAEAPTEETDALADEEVPVEDEDSYLTKEAELPQNMVAMMAEQANDPIGEDDDALADESGEPDQYGTADGTDAGSDSWIDQLHNEVIEEVTGWEDEEKKKDFHAFMLKHVEDIGEITGVDISTYKTLIEEVPAAEVEKLFQDNPAARKMRRLRRKRRMHKRRMF